VAEGGRSEGPAATVGSGGEGNIEVFHAVLLGRVLPIVS
jgi:hypothetical protein